MDFYFDEQLPKAVAESLHALEGHNRIHNVYSTEEKFGKGIKDPELIIELKKVNGILITNDLKMITRKNEFHLIKEQGVTAFMISLPSGVNFQLIYQTIFNKWEDIKKIAKNTKHPFICRIKMRGKEEFL